MPADSKQPQPPEEGAAAGAGPTSLLLSHARLADGRTVDVRLVGDRIEAVGTAGSLAPVAAGPGWTSRASAAARSRRAPRPRRHRVLGGPPRPRPVRRGGGAAPGHGGRAAPARARGDRATRARGDRRRAGPRAAGGGAPGPAFAARPRRVAACRRAPAADRGGGADGRALLRDAVRRGAVAVGGRPDLDPDPAGHVAAVLEVAAEHGVPVDLHTEGDDPAWLARLAAMAGELTTG